MLNREGTDQRVFGLLPDPHARHHILAADGEGAQAVLDLLGRHKTELNGQITVVYADTGPAAANFALRLCQQDIDRVCVMATLLGTVALLSMMIERAEVGIRIYAAGSDTLISLIIQLAAARGLDPMSVIAESRCEQAALG